MRLRRGTRVLDRGDGSLHIGTAPGVILRAVSPDERAFLERLETTASITAVQQERRPALVKALVDAALIEPTPAPPRTVGITDAGPLGLGIGAALAADGWSVRLTDAGPVAAAPRFTYGPHTIASSRDVAGSASIRAAYPRANVYVGDGPADVWVLVSHGAPCLERAVPLMAQDIPHVFVVAHEHGARVGPLVVPGSSPCGWCWGMSRTEADAAWPLLSLQLTAPGSPLPLAASSAAATAAGLAASALSAWRSERATPWLGSTWLVRPDEPPLLEELAPAAGCGCGAAGPVGDDLSARRARYGTA